MMDYNVKRYTKVSITGLKNLGNTSYFNALFQCLGNIYNIANYFLDPNNINKINSNLRLHQLSFVVMRLFQHFYPYPEKDEIEIYDPENFFKILKNLKFLNNYDRIPPNNLLIFLFERLHSELNEKQRNLDLNKIQSNNLYDREQIIKNDLTNFIDQNDDIISNNFNFFCIKEFFCTECNNPKYELKSFNSFDLEIDIIIIVLIIINLEYIII